MWLGNSSDEINFPHKMLLTDTQVLRLCKAFANDFSKTHLSKIMQLEWSFSGSLGIFPIGPLSLVRIMDSLLTLGMKFSWKKINEKKVFLNWVETFKILEVNALGRKIKTGISSSGILLPNNGMKDFVKVFRSYENKGIQLNGIKHF